MEIVHYPVMRNEVLASFPEYGSGMSMVDCTLGEGGHSSMFLHAFSDLRVTGLDRDNVIIEKAKERLKEFGERFSAVNTWFNDYLPTVAENSLDFVLFDLGISTFHYVESQRGFSFRKEERLDMRLDRNAQLSAYEVVNFYRRDDLADVIYNYGEERYSRRIAQAIEDARRIRNIETTKELENIIYHSVPENYRHQHIHPATRTFQAIRIEVNKELDRIEPSLKAAIRAVKPGGRVAVITFHSLEDRIAKWTFKKAAEGENPEIRLINKKPMEPTEEECNENPPSRSAKLRVVEKIR